MMKKVGIYLSAFILLNIGAMSNMLWAANIYVDPALSNDCTNGNYSISNRNCNGNDGNAYRIVIDAVNSMSGGDDIFLRGGTYGPLQLTGDINNGYVQIPKTKNGNSQNYSSIQSYPGEWAILDGDNKCGPLGGVIGLSYAGHDRAYDIQYWKFERLEIKNGASTDKARASGIWANGGPFIVRYCYIHDNIANTGGNNPGGILGYMWHNSIVEYNYFKDNGTDSTTFEQHSVVGPHFFSDYKYQQEYWETAPVDIDLTHHKNIVRYNLFDNKKHYAEYGIHNKGRQYLAHKTNVTWDYKEYGDKYHHNIFLDCKTAIGGQQDFQQIYNNIIEIPVISSNRSGITVTDITLSGNNMAVAIYNNTIIRGRIMNNFGFSTYVVNPYIYMYNNLMDEPPSDYDGSSPINLGQPYMTRPFTYNADRVDVSNNYLYRGTSDNIKVTRNSDDGYGPLPISEFDSYYRKSNFSKSSSEGSDPLYAGTTGANQYITRGEHRVSDDASLESAGRNGNHPYLSGVTIPSYIGATDPNDNGWVASVLSLSSPDILKTAQADSDWEEGDDSQAAVDELPGDVGGLQIIMD